MTKQFWINLPVKDVNRSREFFKQIGFKLNAHAPNSESSASFYIGSQNVVMMLFDEATFKGFAHAGICDVSGHAEILLSIDAESKDEVDELTAKAVAAGGSSDHKHTEMKGFMYGSLFQDLDGHRWNVLYMDMSRMPR